MKIIIENIKFPFDIGCKLLKLKHTDCPKKFENTYIREIWDSIEPANFTEIARFENLEQRRVGVLCLGLERLLKEVNPTLIDRSTLTKQTTWINGKGELETINFNDTYELYEVEGALFNQGIEDWRKMESVYFVKCKDTSTERDYLIWVDIKSVKSTNDISHWNKNSRNVNAIDCIAWTIQTNIPEGNIEKIVRQGDCVLIKTKGKYEPLRWVRHLTANEYKTLLVAES